MLEKLEYLAKFLDLLAKHLDIYRKSGLVLLLALLELLYIL